MSPEKKQKLADAREKATGEKLKVSREANTLYFKSHTDLIAG